ncbi:MerR family transcriptional regulator [Paraburkholderia phenoliruptrix]|nr:MerR family transcriptional regulator [Paraburkholderia phenoliruptrix]MBW9099044.1 MerR family transcriptional regulator [Paraburkholderia phenoliruptrix]
MTTHSPALLTVREVAGRLGATPRTLKVLRGARTRVAHARNEGHYRLYDERDLLRFGRILRLRSQGFPCMASCGMLKRPMENGQRQAACFDRIATADSRRDCRTGRCARHTH